MSAEGGARITVWNGPRIYEALRAGAMRGIDSLLSDCVVESKARVPVRTAILQGSIQARMAKEESPGVVAGYWGSYRVKYAIYVHEGTQPHVILPRNKRALWWQGAAHPVPMVFHPGTRPNHYLTDVAEERYPSLALRIGMMSRMP